MSYTSEVTNDLIPDSWSCSLVDGQLVEEPVSWPTSDEHEAAIVLSILVAGICRSDVKEMNGERHGMTTFGHEIVGRLQKVYGAVDLEIGCRYVLDPHVPIVRSTGFASHLVARGSAAALKNAFVEVPRNIPVDRLVLTEPLACSVHTVSRLHDHLRASGLSRSCRVVVLGAGVFGVLIACLLRRLGHDVTIANRSSDRLVRIASMVEAEAINICCFPDLPLGTFEVAVVAAANVTRELMTLGARCLVDHGLLHLFAGTRPGDVFGTPQCDLDVTRRREMLSCTQFEGRGLFIGGSHGATRKDFIGAINWLADPSDPLELERLVTARVPLTNLTQTLRDVQSKAWHGRILVDPFVPASAVPERQAPQASIWLQNGSARLQRRPINAIGDGIVLRVLAVGLCGTDRQIADGSRPDIANVLGHEAVCEVEVATGPLAERLSLHPGRRVVINPVDRDDPDFVIGHSSDGALQQRLFIPGTRLLRELVVPFEGHDLILGTLIEPLGSALYGLDVVGALLGPIRQLGIIGAGPAGLLVAHAARMQGISHVRVISNNALRSQFILDQGILSLDEIITIENNCAIPSFLKGQFDSIFHCATRRATEFVFDLAGISLRNGGALNLMAGITDTARTANLDVEGFAAVRRANVCGRPTIPARTNVVRGFRDEYLVTGHRGTSAAHLARSAHLLANNAASFRRLITDVIGLSEACALIDNWAAREKEFGRYRRIKVVVDMQAPIAN